MLDLREVSEFLRLDATRALDPQRRTKFGQFLTPLPVADHMASLIGPHTGHMRVLEPGAGTGALIAALVAELCSRNKKPDAISVTAIEIDESLIGHLRKTIDLCATACAESDIGFEAEVVYADFIEETVRIFADDLFGSERPEPVHCIITNPPYGKIRSKSHHRERLRRLGIETGNLYAGFLAAATLYLADEGEMVAITPRSFCNGPYFRAFREFFLDRMSFRHISTFERRDEAFGADDVLQENIVFRAVRSPRSAPVTISASQHPGDLAPAQREMDPNRLVWRGDAQRFIHIVADEVDQHIADTVTEIGHPLKELGLSVSTGRVVDFRAREYLRTSPGPDTAPLIYPAHVSGGSIAWPDPGGRKPNGLIDSAETEHLMVPRGHYVLVKRFTSKEEKRRLVAAVYDGDRIAAERVAFENHLNYFHRDGGGLAPTVAKGLAVYLNSTLVDAFFRQFSGHTQVNATDLRSIPFPSLVQVEALGEAVGERFPDLQEIDALIDRLIISPIMKGTSPVNAKTRVREAQDLLRRLGLPRAQQNERSALTLLCLVAVTPDTPWEEAGDPLVRIHDILEFISDHYGVRYAENTRETIRRQTIHQFEDAGVVQRNPDDLERAVNSPNTVYQISRSVLLVVRDLGTDAYGELLEEHLRNRESLRERYAQRRNLARVPVQIEGDEIRLSPGDHNRLTKAIVEEFAERFVGGGRVIYVGDTEDKLAFFDEESLSAMGVEVDQHGKMPDVVLYDSNKNWLFLIEAVTSHGPINPMRHDHLNAMFSGCEAGLVFVTAFRDRVEMVRHLDQISWETEVWVEESPDHLIHFDGERFLGPYQ